MKFGSTITYTLTASVPEGSIPQTEVVVTDTLPGYDAVPAGLRHDHLRPRLGDLRGSNTSCRDL